MSQQGEELAEQLEHGVSVAIELIQEELAELALEIDYYRLENSCQKEIVAIPLNVLQTDLIKEEEENLSLKQTSAWVQTTNH
ncbi:unnamed protein product [Dracunculus medinensis]|uniref:HAUS augmin-like complex subunit 2 n=1 Tax=Dracunculus medinensis TaxID=318479 RepID=A0A0N4U8T6_DRAME|nr:unnamed protein product [Dracunculus medinensis]